MEAFCEKGYDNKNLMIANKARMALQVESLVDMATANSHKIKSEIFGKKTKKAKKGWPITISQWNVWETMVRETFTRPGSQYNILNTQMGDWLENPTTFWCISQETEQLFFVDNGNIQKFKRVAADRFS